MLATFGPCTNDSKGGEKGADGGLGSPSRTGEGLILCTKLEDEERDEDGDEHRVACMNLDYIYSLACCYGRIIPVRPCFPRLTLLEA